MASGSCILLSADPNFSALFKVGILQAPICQTVRLELRVCKELVVSHLQVNGVSCPKTTLLINNYIKKLGLRTNGIQSVVATEN